MCRDAPSSSGRDPPPCSSAPPRALLVSSATFLSIIVGTFALVAVLALCGCRLRGRWTGTEYSSSSRDERPGARGGDDAFPVDSLPAAFAYHRRQLAGGGTVAAVDEEDSARECAVCLGAVQEGEMVRRLPTCSHVFHVECIDRWLAAHRTCPLCRSELDPCKLGRDTLPPAQEDPPDPLPPV